MCEIIASHYCEKCKKNTSHMFSGSGTKGSCDCGNHLNPEEKCNMKYVISDSNEIEGLKNLVGGKKNVKG